MTEDSLTSHSISFNSLFFLQQFFFSYNKQPTSSVRVYFISRIYIAVTNSLVLDMDNIFSVHLFFFVLLLLVAL